MEKEFEVFPFKNEDVRNFLEKLNSKDLMTVNWILFLILDVNPEVLEGPLREDFILLMDHIYSLHERKETKK